MAGTSAIYSLFKMSKIIAGWSWYENKHFERGMIRVPSSLIYGRVASYQTVQKYFVPKRRNVHYYKEKGGGRTICCAAITNYLLQFGKDKDLWHCVVVAWYYARTSRDYVLCVCKYMLASAMPLRDIPFMINYLFWFPFQNRFAPPFTLLCLFWYRGDKNKSESITKQFAEEFKDPKNRVTEIYGLFKCKTQQSR